MQTKQSKWKVNIKINKKNYMFNISHIELHFE